LKQLKVLSIIGIVISGIGIFGSLIFLAEKTSMALLDIRNLCFYKFWANFLALIIYGYFLTFSIVALKGK